MILGSSTSHNDTWLSISFCTINLTNKYCLIFTSFWLFFVEFINIGPVYIRAWMVRVQGWGRWWKRLNQRSKMAQWWSLDWLWHPHSPTKGQYSTVRPRQTCAVSGSHIRSVYCQIEALHWCHFTSLGFTWLEKGTLVKQTSWH